MLETLAPGPVLLQGARLEECENIASLDIHLPHVLEDDERQPAHELLGDGAGDVELGLQLLGVEELGEPVGQREASTSLWTA
jgi:hypothetical protein